LSGIRVIVIEEDKTNLKVLIRQLSTWGIQSTPFDNLELVEEISGSISRFDLCIMNVDQPDGAGIKMAEKLIQLSGNKLPVIAVTSRGGGLIQTPSELLTTFLTRPIKQLRLFETIARVLEVSEAELMKVKEDKLGSSSDPYSLNVIIAQDNDLHRAVAERTLQLLGHKCENAFNLDDLQDKLAHKHYDLILLGADENKWKSFKLDGRSGKLNSKDETVVIGVSEQLLEKKQEFDDVLTGNFTGDKLEEKIKSWFEFE
jgi:two-component system sensor histidine kinase/response regulator